MKGKVKKRPLNPIRSVSTISFILEKKKALIERNSSLKQNKSKGIFFSFYLSEQKQDGASNLVLAQRLFCFLVLSTKKGRKEKNKTEERKSSLSLSGNRSFSFCSVSSRPARLT